MTATKVLTPGDADDIARLHVRSFQSFFLTSLGERFLKVFYQSVLQEASGYGVGIYTTEVLVGFAIGCTESNGFYKKVIRHHWKALLIEALPELNYRKVKRIIQNLLPGKQETRTNACGTLLSICTNKDLQGQGLGKSLIAAYESYSRSLGVSKICLTTDSLMNENANAFYLKAGYSLESSFINDTKRKMNLYSKNL